MTCVLSLNRCTPWLRTHAPEYFPDLFPEECAAKLEALKLSEEQGVELQAEEEESDAVKVAVPIEQKTSGGKKKKAPAEIVLMLGQRKGKKQVTIVYGLDLFGIKLKDAAKAAKRKFATGSSVTTVRTSFPALARNRGGSFCWHMPILAVELTIVLRFPCFHSIVGG